MTDYKKILNKMRKAIETQYMRYRYDRVKCPSLKVMADLINHELPQYEAIIRDWSETKGRQMSSGIYYSKKDYDGKKLYVYKRGTRELIFSHSSTETYRHNTEVADWIIDKLDRRKNNI